MVIVGKQHLVQGVGPCGGGGNTATQVVFPHAVKDCVIALDIERMDIRAKRLEPAPGGDRVMANQVFNIQDG